MTISPEAIEAAARAAYAKMAELAPKYYQDQQDLDRYKPWDEISETWREDYKEAISAALTAAASA